MQSQTKPQEGKRKESGKQGNPKERVIDPREIA